MSAALDVCSARCLQRSMSAALDVCSARCLQRSMSAALHVRSVTDHFRKLHGCESSVFWVNVQVFAVGNRGATAPI
jgi:hypothetical protein